MTSPVTFRHWERVIPWLSKEVVEGWGILWEFRFARPVFRKAEKIARSARKIVTGNIQTLPPDSPLESGGGI
jgi:hypothetical protein